MGEVQSVLDAFAVEDLHGLTDGLVLDRMATLVQVVNAATAELACTVRHAEVIQAVEYDGFTSVRSWLIGHQLLSAAEAGRLVRTGRALEHLPAVAAGFAAGTITPAKVHAIAPITAPGKLAAAAAQGVDLAAIDQGLALAAVTQPFDTLKQTVARYQDQLDPDGPEPDSTEGRRLTLARHPEGGCGRFDLDPVGFEK